MAQPAPPFRDFIKRTPPVLASEKQLPPRPLISRRGSTNSVSRSRSRSDSPSPFAGRRSSSVYSRTVSQWNSDRISWTSADFADEPVPPFPLLRPLAYSASTPQLVEKPVEPPILQPRTFSPLIRTPSVTTASQVNTPAPAQEVRDSFFPPRTPPFEPQKKHMRTISLGEAKAALHAPGAVHLLPEELRAKQVRKSRSDEALRKAALNVFATPATATSSEPFTHVDKQGRRRTLLSPRDSFAFVAATSTTPKTPTSFLFRAGAGSQKPMVPLAAQQREASKDKVVKALGLDEFDEPRGRTRQREPRNLNYEHYLRNGKRVAKRSSSQEDSQAQKMAKEYHALLAEQYRKPFDTPGYNNAENDKMIKTYMKMVPQPLFHPKPLAKLPVQVDRNDEAQFVKPYTVSPSISGSDMSAECDPRSIGDVNPHPLDIPSTIVHRRRSTSGTIPISPPEPLARSFTMHSSVSRRIEISQISSANKKNLDSRVSAYYPHVASRKKTKAKNSIKNSSQDSEIPPMPFLFSGGDGHSIESGSYESSPSSLFANPFRKVSGGGGNSRKESDASSKRSRQPLHQRMVKGAADLLKNHDLSNPDDHEPATASTVSEGSPHLVPSPVKSNPKEVHLGWSDIAKSTFDKVISPTKSIPKTDTPTYTQVTAPARPLDETKVALREPESHGRKNSLFGSILDSWKESKAERRREELKKMIRFVPNEEERPAQPTRTSSAISWM